MDKIKRFLNKVPKKHHIEFITALLSIPVLLTVILLNLNNLNQKKEVEPTPKPNQIIISLPPQKNPTAMPTKPECKPGLGEVSISNPEEDDTVTDNPITVTVVYNPGDYCSAVWSYRVNNGSWSDYDDKSIALYNFPSGSMQLELRVKSIVNGVQKTITRNFIYKSNTPTSSPSNTPMPTSTPTQILTPTVTQ